MAVCYQPSPKFYVVVLINEHSMLIKVKHDAEVINVFNAVPCSITPDNIGPGSSAAYCKTTDVTTDRGGEARVSKGRPGATSLISGSAISKQDVLKSQASERSSRSAGRWGCRWRPGSSLLTVATDRRKLAWRKRLVAGYQDARRYSNYAAPPNPHSRATPYGQTSGIYSMSSEV